MLFSVITVGVILLNQLSYVSTESLVFNEDFSKGLNFGIWKHELVGVSMIFLLFFIFWFFVDYERWRKLGI
jgi:hypothetical protein